LSFDSLSADLYRETSNAQLEQVLRVEGDATLPAVRRIVSAVDTYEGDSAVSTADTDPATSATGHQRATVGPQGPATLSVAGGGNELAVSRGGGSTGETISTTAAGGANACNLQVDGLPCGFARGTAAGGLSHTLSVLQAGSAELVDVASSSSQPTVYLRRYVPGAGQVGLIREEVTWSLPEIQVGGVPSGVTPPPGWQGYWVRLTGFSATARAEAGVGTTTPTVTISGGQVQAWDGDGYQTVAVTTNGGDVPITPVDLESGPPEDRIGVEITGSVLVEPSSVAEVVTTGSTRTEGQARIGSPMVVSLNYRVLRNDVVVADVSLELIAGRGAARTIYRPTS